jgi:hypothetical protein
MPKGTQAPGKVCPIPSVPIIGFTYSTCATAFTASAVVSKNRFKVLFILKNIGLKIYNPNSGIGVLSIPVVP